MGLAKGFAVTFRQMFRPRLTTQYPDEKRPKPERFHANGTMRHSKPSATGARAKQSGLTIQALTRKSKVVTRTKAIASPRVMRGSKRRAQSADSHSCETPSPPTGRLTLHTPYATRP